MRLLLTGALAFIAATPCLAYDKLELQIAGVERSARVFPGKRAAAEPAPLVILFHGRGDTEGNFARAVRLHKDWPEATVVYPRGMVRKDEGSMRGWLGSVDREDTNDDLEFVDSMLAELPRRYKVDPERVYVGGFSNGGRFTFILMAERPSAFAAFVPIGALSPQVAGATMPRPVMYLFGRGEPREFETQWAETVVALVRLNGGTGEKQEWAPGFTEYLSGVDGAQTIVNLYDAGHIWPYRGNDYIIRFLQSHRLPVNSDGQ